MADITNNFYPIPAPASRPIEQRPQEQGQPQNKQQQPQNITAQAQNPSKKAPLNVLPSDDALERLVGRAQDAQNQGQTLDRGSILNLII